jgi:hypothetical protein
MNWEQWFCPNQACADWAWMVLSDPTMCEVWWVAAHADERPFRSRRQSPSVRAVVRHCSHWSSLKAVSIGSLAPKWDQCSISCAAWRNGSGERNLEGRHPTRKEGMGPSLTLSARDPQGHLIRSKVMLEPVLRSTNF